MDYTAPNIGREFGTVYLGDKNVAYSVVSAGWARVRTILLSFLSVVIVFAALYMLLIPSSIFLIR